MATNEVTEGVKGKGKAKIRRLPPKEFERLKAERVQLVAQRLESLPGWRLIHDGMAIQRVHEFPELRVALAYAAYVGELSTSLKVPASVALAGSRVAVTVRGLRRRGFREVTDVTLDFAAELG